MANRKKRERGGQQHFPATGAVSVLEGRETESRPSTAREVTVRESLYAERREGPIPDAAEMLRYGEAHPEAPVIILEEFKSQGAHRRRVEQRVLSLDKKALEAAIFSERLGVICALIISLVGFGCATFLVAGGHGVEGTVIFGLDVGALVSAFILGRPRAEPPRPDEPENPGKQEKK